MAKHPPTERSLQGSCSVGRCDTRLEAGSVHAAFVKTAGNGQGRTGRGRKPSPVVSVTHAMPVCVYSTVNLGMNGRESQVSL